MFLNPATTIIVPARPVILVTQTTEDSSDLFLFHSRLQRCGGASRVGPMIRPEDPMWFDGISGLNPGLHFGHVLKNARH